MWACTEALALQPNNVKALFRRAAARAAIHSGADLEAAVADLSRAARISPGNTEARQQRSPPPPPPPLARTPPRPCSQRFARHWFFSHLALCAGFFFRWFLFRLRTAGTGGAPAARGGARGAEAGGPGAVREGPAEGRAPEPASSATQKHSTARLAVPLLCVCLPVGAPAVHFFAGVPHTSHAERLSRVRRCGVPRRKAIQRVRSGGSGRSAQPQGRRRGRRRGGRWKRREERGGGRAGRRRGRARCGDAAAGGGGEGGARV